MTEKPLTAQQAAAFLQISPRLLYRLIDSGQLAGKKVGSRYRTTDAACIAYLHSPGETKQANTGDHKGAFLCQSPSEVEYGTVISLHRQAKELDVLLTRGTKSKRRSCTTN